MLAVWRRGLLWLEKIEMAVAIVLFASIVVAIFCQVVSRYGFNWPLVWVEEASIYAFIWIVFLGAAIGAKRLSHIRIEALSLAFPARGQAFLRLLGAAVMLFVTVYLIIRLPAVLRIEMRSVTVSLPVQLPRMWFYSVPLLYACISMALTQVYFVAAGAVSLRTGVAVTGIGGQPDPKEGI
ncbi:MAG: TRAP transporter small permease [Proteobacteria bacterium]|nr:TRAP transporter small permease [Pseudomonadota bacterium]